MVSLKKLELISPKTVDVLFVVTFGTDARLSSRSGLLRDFNESRRLKQEIEGL